VSIEIVEGIEEIEVEEEVEGRVVGEMSVNADGLILVLGIAIGDEMEAMVA